MREKFNIDNMRKAYEAGKLAREAGQPCHAINGWGYPKGKYFGWFKMGWNGQPFFDIADEYAERKARHLIAAEFDRAGMPANAAQYRHEPGFTTAPLRALTRYIHNAE